MLKSPCKSLIIALLLLIFCTSATYAQTRLYQYDGNLPFVQMMLNMMVAMGILDRLPTNTAYGGDYFGSTMPRNLGPFMREPWRQPPWSSTNYSNLNSENQVWGSPSWGVLPLESYTTNNYSAYGPRGLSRVWSSTDLDGWVNEAWESSSWNSNVERPTHANTPSNNLPKKTSSHNIKSQRTVQQKPCVTNFCGLKEPDIDGLWVTRNGEILGIKSHRYLWSDSSSRYLTGLLKIQNEYLLASVDGHRQIMRFKYKLAGNHLLALQPNGKMHEFTRMRNNQYPGQGFDSAYGYNY
ncbi:MAG: hypothetical protein JKX75_02455 [Gammaproteobacteria bacterium]|nr:hypothetical protein [Gammaproteobacteria bacterium]